MVANELFSHNAARYFSFAFLTSRRRLGTNQLHLVPADMRQGSVHEARPNSILTRPTLPPTSRLMALKRQLSQPSPGATPARKAPRLALAVEIPSSPDPVLTGPTVVVSPDDDHPANSPFRYFRNVQPLPANALSHLDPAQLVERLEDLAEEYERSVDEMGAEIEHLKREVSFARRRLEATPSFEARDTAAPFNSTPGVRQPALSGKTASMT